MTPLYETDVRASMPRVDGTYSGAMLIAQFSDCHIVDPGEPFADRVDSAAGLRAAVETMLGLAARPDLAQLGRLTPRRTHLGSGQGRPLR